EVDLDTRAVDRREPRVRAKLGDLVAKGGGRRRIAGRLRLESRDLRAERRDLLAVGVVRALEVLHAVNERLRARDLVRGRQKLRLKLAGDQEADRQRDQGHEGRS